MSSHSSILCAIFCFGQGQEKTQTEPAGSSLGPCLHENEILWARLLLPRLRSRIEFVRTHLFDGSRREQYEPTVLRHRLFISDNRLIAANLALALQRSSPKDD